MTTCKYPAQGMMRGTSVIGVYVAEQLLQTGLVQRVMAVVVLQKHKMQRIEKEINNDKK